MTSAILTIQQLEEKTQLSRATIYRLIAAGQIRTIKIGGSVRVPQAELNRFLRTLSLEQHGEDITVLDSDGGLR
jgi:hypothetical protein